MDVSSDVETYTVASIKLPKGGSRPPVTRYVKVKGSLDKIKALIDTGAAVSLVNKDFVQRLNSVIEPVNSRRAILFADDSALDVEGAVSLEVTICDIPVKFYAVYVPTLSYELILGTDVLYESDVQLVCGGKVIWPLPSNARKPVSLDLKESDVN